MTISTLQAATISSTANQVYELTDSDFNNIRQLVSKHTGISLSDHKRDLVYGRLRKRLKVHGLTRFRDYCTLVEENSTDEVEHFINAITTNLTAFFREQHHFDYISNELMAPLLERLRKNRKLRIWSAGCSTGEEPYSLAITLREAIDGIDNHDIRILATDLDTNAVETAARGIYPETRIEGLDDERVKRWFQRGTGQHKGMVKASPDLQKMITFKQLNLMHSWPMNGKFDIIFCRNVVIYFDKPTQKKLFEQFANIMLPQSHLFIGHSENLHKITERFQLIGKTIYKKVDQ
jgi:chemotaxis protein methyltransferase CheR